MEIIKQNKTKTDVRKTSIKTLTERELRGVAYARVSTDHEDQKTVLILDKNTIVIKSLRILTGYL